MSYQPPHIFHYYIPPHMREMTQFTCDENDELLRRIKDHADDPNTLSFDPLEPSVEKALAVSNECPPLKTAADAILLNDMFALFLSSGESGYVIAVSGGFGAADDREYHVVGAGNAGSEGVRRPSDELCAELERACTNFISGSTGPLNPDDEATSEVLVAALDICHAEVVRRLDTIADTNFATSSTTNFYTLSERGLQPYRNFCLQMAVLKDSLNPWERLERGEKTIVATLYGYFLKSASEVWTKIKDLGSTRFKIHEVFICGFDSIARGLRLLRNFPRGTSVVFDWPQGPTNGDRSRFRIGDYQWPNAHLYTNCQLHCEIYLALHILFSNSDVRFHSFLVEEGKQVYTIGCSKPSCLACWDTLLELSTRQDVPNHPVHVCRTGSAHGRCYATWGLTPHVETLPLSLVQEITGSKEAEMLESLHRALKRSLQKFRWRVNHQRNFGHLLGPTTLWRN